MNTVAILHGTRMNLYESDTDAEYFSGEEKVQGRRMFASMTVTGHFGWTVGLLFCFYIFPSACSQKPAHMARNGSNGVSKFACKFK